MRLILALLIALGATPALAETQSERDARRTGCIEGFSCWKTASGGYQTRFVFEKNGAGEIYNSAGGMPLRWKVQADTLCITVNGTERCNDLPNRDTGDEEEKFKTFMGRICRTR
ncbi:MAG: hypothetical protein AAF401_07705 [Pseudomonadota bacterium]